MEKRQDKVTRFGKMNCLHYYDDDYYCFDNDDYDRDDYHHHVDDEVHGGNQKQDHKLSLICDQ